MGHILNTKIRYTGIAAITFSLVMLSLGSIPTSQAQTIGSTLNVHITCGVTIANPSIDWTKPLDPTNLVVLNSVIGSDFSGTPPTLTNPNTNTANAQVKAHVGDDATGGYYGTVDGLTHIAPSQIDVDLITDTSIGPPNPMDNGGVAKDIGTIAPDNTDTLHLIVHQSPLSNLPTSDIQWQATITISSTCAIV